MEFNSLCEGRLGGYIKNNLKIIRLLIEEDWDAIILVTGLNGDGKTTFVKTASYYLDPNTSIDNWAYSPEQFEEIVDRPDIKPGTNVVWDESDDLTGHWANRMVMAIKGKFKRIRDHNLIIWLITPTLFDINKYFIRRVNCVIDVYANPVLDKERMKIIANRGYLRFFGKDKKRILYYKGKKEFDNMYAILPDFSDSFSPPPPEYPISKEALDAKKHNATKGMIQNANFGSASVSAIPKYRQDCVARFEQWSFINCPRKITLKDCEYVFGVSNRTVKADRAFLREKAVDEAEGVVFEGVKRAEYRSELPPKKILLAEEGEVR